MKFELVWKLCIVIIYHFPSTNFGGCKYRVAQRFILWKLKLAIFLHSKKNGQKKGVIQQFDLVRPFNFLAGLVKLVYHTFLFNNHE
jgi:hypothetical protein